MTDDMFSPCLADLFATLDSIDTPMFVVAVENGKTLRYVGVNSATTATSGLKNADVVGRTPEEAFPPRMAETLSTKYLRCVELQSPYSYEEVLDLPKGQLWWRTVLTPVIDDGIMVGILGSATEITEAKSLLQTTSDNTTAMREEAKRMQASARAAMVQMRGPLNNIVSLGQMLRAELKPPLEHKELLLGLLMETAVHAIEKIDDLEHVGGGASSINAMVDIDHICRDIAALVDPDRGLNISFPKRTLYGNLDLVPMILNAAIHHAAERAQSYVAVTIGASVRRPDGVVIHIDWDTIKPSAPDPARPEKGHPRLEWLEATVSAHGGQVLLRHEDTTQNKMQLDIHVPANVLMAPNSEKSALDAAEQSLAWAQGPEAQSAINLGRATG